MEIWASRIHPSKAHSVFHSPHILFSENQLRWEEAEVNEEARTYMTCPFCYVDTDLSLLAPHLQHDHCFDLSDAVCPVCALNLGKDVAGHFMVYHTSSLKTRRRSPKSSIWSSYSAQELSISKNNRADNANDFAPDPLLSPFLCRIPYPEIKEEEPQNTCPEYDSLSTPDTESSNQCMSEESREDSKELRQKAAFCQQLMLSIIF